MPTRLHVAILGVFSHFVSCFLGRSVLMRSSMKLLAAASCDFGVGGPVTGDHAQRVRIQLPGVEQRPNPVGNRA